MDLPTEVTDKKQLVKEFTDLEEINAREAKSRAVVLEILGDIPDADVAPPKNVLFVCKLNPVTEQDDLKIIFSRFGNVKSCDVIRDYKTGDSLQYAFVEFETEDACNDAYFRMQNVLIDDRRIHVDFCQSVSGFWKRFKDNGTFTRAPKHHASSAKDSSYRIEHASKDSKPRMEYRDRRERSRERSRRRRHSRSISHGRDHRKHRRDRSRDRSRYRSRDRSRDRHSERRRVSRHSRSRSPDRRKKRARSPYRR